MAGAGLDTKAGNKISTSKMTIKKVLVIAGSDSSGGAGLEADQKVIAAHGCYASTVTTALTAQNTQGVHGIHQTPPHFVNQLLDAVLSDVDVDVVKTGMLASDETIKVVTAALRKYGNPTTIVDPVMISTSGSALLPHASIKRLREELLPITTVLTPNVPEALYLLKDAGIDHEEPRSVDDMAVLAKRIQELGPKWVLVKGGHLPFNKDGTLATNEEDKIIVVDVLYGEGQVHQVVSSYQKSNNTHGTGCSLASAIASNVANGLSVPAAVKAGCRFIEAGIRTGQDIGKGNNKPINHFHSCYTLPFAPGHFVEYLLERSDVQPAWREHTQHSFLQKLAHGTLPLDSFKNYLIQDYLYLVQYARATSLAGYKLKSIDQIASAAEVVTHITHEMTMHIAYCNEFGISEDQIMSTEENEACTAYTRYVLDVGMSEDWLALQMAMAPCAIGYAEIGRRLYTDAATKRDGNPYWKWIELYAGEDFKKSVKSMTDTIEKHAALQSPSRIEELVKVFVHATNMETGFWDMGEGKKVKDLQHS